MIKPVGYQLLIKPLEGASKIGSIEMPDSIIEQQRLGATVCEVIDMGPDAYDGEKFKTPWCKVGDFVLIGKFAGDRFKYNNVEYRLLDDDKILGLTDEPENVMRVF